MKQISESVVTSWTEVAETLKRRAELAGGRTNVIVRLVEMNVETDDGDVHDVYEAPVSYDAEENLEGDELVEVVRERYSENEKYVKTYRSDRGVENHNKMVEDGGVWYLDALIIQ